MSTVDSLITPVYKGSHVQYYEIVSDGDVGAALGNYGRLDGVVNIKPGLWWVFPRKYSAHGILGNIKKRLEGAE